PLEQIDLSSGTSNYLVADLLGSVRGIVSNTGSLTASTSYDAWGNPQTTGGLTAASPFGYAGSYTDPTGLTYNINRYYDSSTGQFVTVDPMGSQTGSPYGYADGDPIDSVDPLGLFGIPGTSIHVNLPSPGKVLHAAGRVVSAEYHGAVDLATSAVSTVKNLSTSAVSAVIHGASYLGQTAYENADWIAAASATIALVPGPQQPFFAAAAAVASVIAAGQDIRDSNYSRATFDIAGALAGAGAFTMARLAPRIDALAMAISSDELAAIADYASRVAGIDRRRAYRLLAESLSSYAKTGDVLAASTSWESFAFAGSPDFSGPC